MANKVKSIKPAFFLGSYLSNPKVYGAKVQEIIDALNCLICDGADGFAVCTDGVTITGDGTTGNCLTVEPATVAVCTDDVTITGDGTTGNCLTVEPFTVPVCTDATLTGDGTTGNCLSVVATPIAPLSSFASFYGLTTGTGNGGPNDYAATVAVKTAAGTGRVPFPRTGPSVGGIVNGSTVFTIPTAGTYEVNFNVRVTEATGGQLQLEVNGTDLPETVSSSRADAIAGMHAIIGSSIITVPAGALLAVVNPSGNAAALTITPADGSLTHANAETLTIKRLA